MGFFLVMKAELVRTFIVMRRYWFATLTSMIVGYGVLLLLIVGFMAKREEMTEAVSNRFGVDPESATNAALGFIIGIFAFGVVGIFSQGLQALARSGQLEQLCLSPHGLVTNFLARTFVASGSSVFTSAIMLVLIAKTVDGQLHVAPAETVVLLFLTFANLLGFGFMVGGLVLVFKQTGQIAALIRMALLFFAFMVSEPVNTGFRIIDTLVHFVPVTDAAICLKYVLIRGQLNTELGADGEIISQTFQSVFTTTPFYFLIVNCLLWTLIGIALFKWMENWSRDKGTLGAY